MKGNYPKVFGKTRPVRGSVSEGLPQKPRQHLLRPVAGSLCVEVVAPEAARMTYCPTAKPAEPLSVSANPWEVNPW